MRRHAFAISLAGMNAKSDPTHLSAALRTLNQREFDIIIKRYWQRETISDIARSLRLSWDSVDRTLTRALMALRSRCLSDQRP